MPRKSPFSILLSEHERKLLEERARKYTSSYRAVVRAKIILYAPKGWRPGHRRTTRHLTSDCQQIAAALLSRTPRGAR